MYILIASCKSWEKNWIRAHICKQYCENIRFDHYSILQNHLPTVEGSCPAAWYVTVCPSRTVTLCDSASTSTCWWVLRCIKILLKPPVAIESSSPLTDRSRTKEKCCCLTTRGEIWKYSRERLLLTSAGVVK